MNYDTLDYLIPPVRKRCENSNHTKEFKNVTRNFPRQGLSTKLANHITQLSQSLKTSVGTSSSIVWKKITDKFLLEQLSISNFHKREVKHNYSSKGKTQRFPTTNKNIIKITVIPISAKSSEIDLKRNQKVKKIHKTVSNTKNSIKANILSSHRHRREILINRETNNAGLLEPRTWERNIKHDELSLNRMTYTKTIIDSLNMNHKRRQERITHESNEIQVSSKGSRKNPKTMKQECTCDNSKINSVLNDMNSRNNRFTIVGQLGINEIDQYVLNCAATVNNNPIEANIGRQNLSSASNDLYEDNIRINKITKATQADTNIGCITDRLKNETTNNKNIQCLCKNAKDIGTSVSQSKFQESEESKSPLIVISVYPTKNTLDLDDMIQIKQPQQLQESGVTKRSKNFRNTSDRKKMATTGVHISMKKYPQNRSPSPRLLLKPGDIGNVDNRSPRHRSPTPPIKTFNNDKVQKRNVRSRSPSPVVKTVTRDHSKSKVIQRSGQESIKNPGYQERQPRAIKALPQKDRPHRNPVVNTVQTSKINQFKSAFGINETSTKNNKVKKALVNNYTQKMLEPVKGKDVLKHEDIKSKGNTSSVTINIDGDNEQYQVLFLQDKLSTDLSIRKTTKPHKYKMLNDLKNKSNEDSMEVKRMLNKEAVDKRTPGFKIRDSLEMSYCHGNGSDQCKKISNNYEPTIKIMPKPIKKNMDNEDFSAPVKHYRGDQCCIPNPNVRDQEIRDLLGIRKPRSGKFEFVQEILPELVGQNLHYNLRPTKCTRSSSSVSSHCYNSLNVNQNKVNMNDQPEFVSAWTQYEQSPITSCKQMVLNRNIQVFLEVEQFTKQRPIILSRTQYEKVKKTIQKKASTKISQERRRLNNSTKCSVVSIGEIRKTRKQQILNMKINRNIQAEHDYIHEQKGEEKEKSYHEENKSLLLLHTVEKTNKNDPSISAGPRRVVSSMEIHYASLAHLRHVAFSSSNTKSKSGSLLSVRKKVSPSIQTIFKGHKKCVTPNLGISGYSLYSDEEINFSDNQYSLYPQDEKAKKPFLRRLISCFVMRSNRTSEAKLPPHYEQPPSMMNSIDSYHINTSLEAIEITSSLYDTSASFYSNHTILPIARMKRGFFSSVRGFLTNRKGR